MSFVDLALGLLLLAGIVGGWRSGTVGTVLTFVGFWAGLALASVLVANLVPSLGSPGVRSAVTLAALLGISILLAIGGRLIGAWSNALLRRVHLGLFDSIVGAIAAALGVLLSAWLVGSLLAQSQYSGISSAIQNSAVMRTVDRLLPPVPSFFSRVQAFLQEEGFPTAFAQLAPELTGPVATPTAAQAQAIGQAVAGSTAKVLGSACEQQQEGSSFVVAPHEVLTNAHVVAGEHDTHVVVGGASYRAVPTLFDPNDDLALLRTSAPLGPPLTLDPQLVGRGTEAAVVGYPEMGSLTVTPAGVAGSIQASTRTIYDTGIVVRDIYQLDADVQPGNSGSPVVTANHAVVGMVFSRSTAQQGVGYALTSPFILARVQEAESRTAAVSTGGCVPG